MSKSFKLSNFVVIKGSGKTFLFFFGIGIFFYIFVIDNKYNSICIKSKF